MIGRHVSLCEAKYKAMEGVSNHLTSKMLHRTACARFRAELSLGSHFGEEVYFELCGLVRCRYHTMSCVALVVSCLSHLYCQTAALWEPSLSSSAAKVRCSRRRCFTTPVQLHLSLAVLLSCLLDPARGRPNAECCGCVVCVKRWWVGAPPLFQQQRRSVRMFSSCSMSGQSRIKQGTVCCWHDVVEFSFAFGLRLYLSLGWCT